MRLQNFEQKLKRMFQVRQSMEDSGIGQSQYLTNNLSNNNFSQSVKLNANS